MIQDIVYNQILERLAAEVPEVKTIDWFNENLLALREGDELPYATPAAFIDFPLSEPQTFGRRMQVGETLFSVILVDEVIGEVSSLETDAERTRSQALYAVCRSIEKALIGFSNDKIGSIGQSNHLSDHAFDNLQGLQMGFKTMVKTLHLLPETTTIEGNLKVTQGRCN